LIDNPNIRHGDPILFYFAGHGSRVTAPSSWPIAWKDSDERREIEAILPYDSVRDTRKARHDREIPGIPDRTLGSLLRKIAARHGSNITVVLDCCASGHGTRNVSALPRSRGIRSVDAAYVGRLSDDTDRELWSDDMPSGATKRSLYLRGAFADNQDDSHILLAACGRNEDSNGSIEGGWFTTALIDALKDPAVSPRSYAEILKHVRATFSRWYQGFQSYPLDQRPDPQTPQCEGINRDRTVFQNTAVDRTRFAVRPMPHEVGRARIDVGEVYGVLVGTKFELRHITEATSDGSQQTVVGTAVAVQVMPGSCIVELPDGVSAASRMLLAVAIDLHKRLRYAVINDHPRSPAAGVVFEDLQQRLRSMSPETSAWCQHVEVDDQPELVLRVGDGGVTLDRKDLHMSYLTSAAPFIEATSVSSLFPDVLAWIARFNLHLQRDNPEHPYVHEVDVRLHVLTKASEDSQEHEQEYMVPGEEYIFHGQEAVVPAIDHLLYGLVFENDSQQSLFPHIVLFDPATYSIEQFYSPMNPHDPPLKPGNQLQLGRSSESMTALSFYLPEGQQKDTGILKVHSSGGRS
jgi:hypothetical protein